MSFQIFYGHGNFLKSRLERAALFDRYRNKPAPFLPFRPPKIRVGDFNNESLEKPAGLALKLNNIAKIRIDINFKVVSDPREKN
jgi:hypothetical protein